MIPQKEEITEKEILEMSDEEFEAWLEGSKKELEEEEK